MLGLEVRIVSRSDGSHGRGFVSRVRLRGVLEIRVGATRAVDADVSRHADVGAAVGLTHHGDHCYLTGKKIRREYSNERSINGSAFLLIFHEHLKVS